MCLNTYSIIPKLEGRKNWNWHFSEITVDCDHTEVCDLELSLGASFVKRIQDIFIEKVQQTWTNNSVTTIKLHTFYAICGPPLKAVVHPTLKLKEGAIKKDSIYCANMIVKDEVRLILKCPFYDNLRTTGS